MDKTDNRTRQEISETFQELGFFGEIKQEKWNDFVQAVQNNVSHSRQESGNLEFNLYQYASEPNKFVLIESWQNADNHKAHLEQEYSRKLTQLLEDVFTSNPMDTRWLVKDISINK